MNLTKIEQALDVTLRMINARAALQLMYREQYWVLVKGFVDGIKEKRRQTGKSAVEILTLKAEGEWDQRMLLTMMAATIEIIEEDAKCDGAL